MPVFFSYVLLLFCALILAGIGVLIAFIGEKACLSRQCVGQARFIHRGMDKDLDPCDNFYNFVCAKFPQYGTLIVDEIEKRLFKRLIQFLAVPADWDKDTKAEHTAKTLYQNCMNDSQLIHEGLKPLERVIMNIGGIPFLEPLWDYQRKAEFGVVDTDLKHFFNGLNSVFVKNRVMKVKVNPAINPKNETDEEKKARMYFVYAIPPHYYTDVAPTRENYLKYCLEFNQLYSNDIKTNKTISEDEKKEILAAYDFKVKMLKLIDRTRDCSEQPFKFLETDYTKGFGWYNEQDQRVGRPLQVYVTTKAQPGELVINYVLLTPHFDKYIDDVNEILKGVSKRVLAIFMGVEALYQVTHFLPPQYRDLYDKYLRSDKEKQNYVLSNRNFLCAKCVKDAMATAISVEYLHKNPTIPEQIALMRPIVSVLLQEIKGILRRIKWPTKRDKWKINQIANKIKVVSPLPDDVLYLMSNRTAFEMFYLILCTYDDSTLESYLLVRSVQRIRNAQSLNSRSEVGDPFPLTIFHEDYDIFDSSIYFQEDSNSIVLPMEYLYYPSLDSLWPKYLSFGGVAVWIAHQIIKTLSYENVAHPPPMPHEDDKPMPPPPDPWFEPQTIFNYEQKRECTLREYNKFLKPFRVSCSDANCVEDPIYYSAAVEAAYAAYKEYTRMRFFVEARIPYLTSFTVDQIFFIKYASSFCRYQGASRPYKTDNDTAWVSKNFTLLYSLKNFPKFKEVFNCEKTDNMAKEETCDIWGEKEVN